MLRRHETIRMLEIPQSTHNFYVCRNVDARYRLSCINAVEQFWCYLRKVTVSYCHSYNKTQIKNKQYRLILIFARHLLIQHDTIDKSIHVIDSRNRFTDDYCSLIRRLCRIRRSHHGRLFLLSSILGYLCNISRVPWN